MKNSIKIMLGSMLAAVAMCVVSCSEWNEPKNLEIKTPSLEERDPALWAEYLAALQAYKSSAHKLVFVTVNNPVNAPAVNRAEHLTVLPDSVDYIVLNNPDNLHADFVKEFDEVRKKSTKVLYAFSYETFNADWLAMAREDSSLTEEQHLEYITACTEEALTLCEKYNYDGLIFAYTGVSPLSIPASQREAAVALQNAYFAPIASWKASHKGKSISFMGRADFVLEEVAGSVFGQCDYVMVDTDNATNESDVAVSCAKALDSSAVPSDRIVVTVLEVQPDDNNQTFGWFGTQDANGNKLRALPYVAQWVASTSPNYTRAGLVIKNVQPDYYNVTKIYPHLREAISIMNPSPKN